MRGCTRSGAEAGLQAGRKRPSWGGHLALVAALALCAALALPAVAAASTPTVIEGKLTEAAAAKAGIAKLCATASKVGREFERYEGVTNTEGRYKIVFLPAGEYKVEFHSCLEEERNFAPRYYNETAEGTSEATKATVVKVAAEKTVAGVDAEMKLGAEITGRVLTASSAPIEEACVFAFEAGNKEGGEPVALKFSGMGESKKGGEYTLRGLATGSYVIEYAGCSEANVVAAFFDENGSEKRTSAIASASKVPVNAEVEPVAPRTLPEVSLEAGGEIEGTITESEGHPVHAPLCISASPTTTPPGGQEGFAGAFAFAQAGSYKLIGLATGSYDLEVEECVEEEPGMTHLWATQYYSGAAGPTEATPVSVSSGHEPPSVSTADFRLVKVGAVRPASTAAPAITGTPALGQTLTCSSGGWSGTPAPSFAYQWLRDGAAIAAANGSTYVVQAADEGKSLACEVTATNEAGSAAASSASVQVPVSPPAKPSSSPPATKESPPPPPAKPGVAVGAGAGAVKGGVARLALRCTGAGACKGRIKLVEKVVRVLKRHGRRRRRVVSVLLGRAAFSIAAGAKKTIEVRLTRKAARLIMKAGRRGLHVSLIGPGVHRRTLLLKLAAKRRSRRGKPGGKGKLGKRRR